ncbi:hypothetical protein [Sulfitobacter noctilucicola]|uniref:Uncharacterized protein n=1 Tax=Sulfitobacter noctilucicola TaxID=1342301 RepID=A0A7W6Q4Y3_9RHOB|nr:hypothetical protein [Sulfitobacter noctilucicola]MBB4175805.1 hypothetical protein [Sulfitobacter noctilucicola]
MNTTPEFDEIDRTVPIEGLLILRCFAALRLCFVVIALCVCVLQLFQIGFWSGTVDRALIFLGVLGGLGLFSDGIEPVWRKLGPPGQLFALFATPLIIVGSVLFSGNVLWSSFGFLTIILLLAAMAYGLLWMAGNPLRAARYRQIQRYLRTLPKSERQKWKERLDRNFQTLIAEGFS